MIRHEWEKSFRRHIHEFVHNENKTIPTKKKWEKADHLGAQHRKNATVTFDERVSKKDKRNDTGIQSINAKFIVCHTKTFFQHNFSADVKLTLVESHLAEKY